MDGTWYGKSALHAAENIKRGDELECQTVDYFFARSGLLEDQAEPSVRRWKVLCYHAAIANVAFIFECHSTAGDGSEQRGNTSFVRLIKTRNPHV